MNFSTIYIGFIGLFLPFLILYVNKGYKTVNLYLAGYLFFSALYVMSNFYFFYGESLAWIVFFIDLHPFFYLIGPLSYFYIRSVVNDSNKLRKSDLLHFLLFFVSLAGLIPYIFSDASHKLQVAAEMKSEHWDLAKYQINKLIPHKADQLLCVVQTVFYSACHWVLVLTQHRRWKKGMLQIPQYQLIHKWLRTLSSIYSIIAIDYFIVVACIWIYDDKSEFLARANIFLMFASLLFMALNFSVLIFPQILYGLPQEKIIRNDSERIHEPEILENEKQVSHLFSDEYLAMIEQALGEQIRLEKYTDPDYKLIQISTKSLIPVHHISYYFNNVKNISFSDWRNKLRIDHAKAMIDNNDTTGLTLNAIAAKSGYTTPSTFIRAFKQSTGKTPSEYMKARQL